MSDPQPLALVTGATRGIGLEVCRQLAATGATVLLGARDLAAGERAALAHAPPTERRVGDARLLLVDWGASGRFYKSDLTRVLAGPNIFASSRTGRPEKGDARLAKVYAAVLQAREAALRVIRPGVAASAVDAAARSAIEAAGFGSYFTHGLGHGLGLQVHESPAIRPDSTDVLQAGMVFTVEPGIYITGWGGVRIEDDVLVTEEGCEVLSHLPIDLSYTSHN